MSYCPICGTKLIILARGHFYEDTWDDVASMVVSGVWSKRWKKYIESKGRLGAELYFVVCVKCKFLYAVWGELNFQVLGKLTDEALALMTVNSIKEG